MNLCVLFLLCLHTNLLVVVLVLVLELLRLMYQVQAQAVFLAARRRVQALCVQVPGRK